MKIDLDNPNGFAVASAIRGPDIIGPGEGEGNRMWSAAEGVKMALTARLRFIVVGRGGRLGWHHGFALNNKPVPDAVPSELTEQVDVLWYHDTKGTTHYLHHIESGAHALRFLLEKELEGIVDADPTDLDALEERIYQARRLGHLARTLINSRTG